MSAEAELDRDWPVVILGAGFAGLAMGARLVAEGRRDFVILEREAELGGTWHVNRYPGCACDVPSHLYSLSFAPNPDWTRSYSPQPEIWRYQRAVAERFGLGAHIVLGADVKRARFDATSARWRLELADGRELRGHVLVSGVGGLSTPALPDIRGRERFAGPSFHSQTWDHGCPLAGRRVAVIGTGASAIQFVPQIVPQVAHLDLYQRTPPWILPKDDRPFSAAERAVFRRVPGAQSLYRTALYWQHEWRAAALVFATGLVRLAEKEARAHLEAQVSDPALRAALTPDYRLGCKRVLLSNDYYPAVARPNLQLVTTGIREIVEDGVVTEDGVHRPADVLIHGTGFKANDPIARGVIFGRDGLDLVDAWREGPEAYKGTTVAGFPNLFFILGPNTGVGHTSVLFMMEAQIRYILGALRCLGESDCHWLEVRPAAQAAFNLDLARRLERTVWSAGGCSSWYRTAAGRNVTLWPGFTFEFDRRLRRFDLEQYARG